MKISVRAAIVSILLAVFALTTESKPTHKLVLSSYEEWRYMGFVTISNNCSYDAWLSSEDYGRGKLVGNVNLHSGAALNVATELAQVTKVSGAFQQQNMLLQRNP